MDSHDASKEHGTAERRFEAAGIGSFVRACLETKGFMTVGGYKGLSRPRCWLPRTRSLRPSRR